MAAEGDEAIELLRRLLAALPRGVAADARLTRRASTTMRIALGRILQPHVERATTVSLRVEVDGRLATATTDELSPDGLHRVSREAVGLARVAPREKKFLGFPGPEGGRPRPVPYSEATERLSTPAEARMARAAISAAEGAAPGSRVSGAVNVGVQALAVVNTSGLAAFARRSFAQASILVDRPGVDPPPSGWSEEAHWDATRLDPARLGREAAERMPDRAPEPVGPGTYRVVLDGSAAAELFGSLGYLGFGGHGEEQGWSALRRVRGKRRFPGALELVDDPRSAWTLPEGIDHEGLPTRATTLIRRGVVGPAVTDLVTAGRLGRPASDAHGLPPESPWGEWGPIPTHLIVKPGTARGLPELLREVGDGLLVTRFHYVRVVDPGRAVLTGMTRDGTYRIVRGELGPPVRNLRFTESALDALGDLLALGRTPRRYADEAGFSSVTCPPLASARFRFTSATLF